MDQEPTRTGMVLSPPVRRASVSPAGRARSGRGADVAGGGPPLPPADVAAREARTKRNRRRRHIEQYIVVWLLRLAAAISILTTLAILVSLLKDAVGFFTHVSVWDFLFGTKWTALFVPRSFGVLPLVVATFVVAVIAAAIALILGMGAAIFMSEYAPERVRRVLKPVLEVLAGIPTVVYGFFALYFVTPLLQHVFPSLIIFNALSGGIVMGLMIMPMVSTLSEDAMVAVPRSLRDAAYALGATRFEVATKVVVPSALSGIVASLILAISRAVGETMIVYIAVGSLAQLSFNPLNSMQTMTAFIAQIATGETEVGSVVYQSIFAVGLLLFCMTLVMNIAGRWFVARYRQKYE